MNLPKAGEKYKANDIVYTINSINSNGTISVNISDNPKEFILYNQWFYDSINYHGLYLLETISESTPVTSCTHDFKLYQGFTESYNYCTKCDYKSK